MNRHCHVPDCPRTPRRRCRYCHAHLRARRLYGSLHATQWTAADEHDVETVVRDARPTPRLTPRERVMVARALTEKGLPAGEIARIVGVHRRTVYRWRAEHFRHAT